MDWIKTFHTEKGYPPTYRDIAGAFGINSTNGVACHIKALVKKGAIKRSLNVARGIVATDFTKIGKRATLARALELMGLAWSWLEHTTLGPQWDAFLTSQGAHPRDKRKAYHEDTASDRQSGIT